MASNFSLAHALAIFLLLTLARGDAIPDSAACPVENPNPASGKVSGIAAYSYFEKARNGPARWGDLECSTGRFAKFANCSYCSNSSCFGRRQSPINIATQSCTTESKWFAPFVFLPQNAKMKYSVAPRNFQIDCRDPGRCGWTWFQGKLYRFNNIHIHSLSEHSLDGKLYPLEIHFVHIARDGSILVVSQLFNISEFNQELDAVFKIAKRKGQGVINLWKLSENARKDLTLYQGSLTTPPCGEDVLFSVSRNIGAVSIIQLEQFLRLIGGKLNNRPVQPLNGRVITAFV